VYLLKLVLVLVCLYGNWVGTLYSVGAESGYDAQRYYFNAKTLAESNFDQSALPGINYVGILYYYGLLFKLVATNPVTPALFNSIVTLAATLCVVSVGYRLRNRRIPGNWTLGLVMIIPEVVWYDAITSRETIVAALLVATSLTLVKCRSQFASLSFSPIGLFVVSTAVFGIAVIRTVMLIPACLTLLLALLVYKKSTSGLLIALITVPFFLLMARYGADLSSALGSQTGLADIVGGDQSLVLNRSDYLWSQDSLGVLLAPKNDLELVLLFPARLILYLVSPFPGVLFSFEFKLFWWQIVAHALSAVLYICLFPYMLAAIIAAMTRKGYRHWLAVCLPLILIFFTIVEGTPYIVERYRVMVVPFLWGAIWLGFECKKSLVLKIYLGWCVTLIVTTVAYVALKQV